MRNVLAVAGKELRTYFLSPVAYVVIGLFLLLWGILFFVVVYSFRRAEVEPLFHNLAFTLFLVLSGFTMRLLAEERSKGTIELLLTSPIRDWEIIAGKFLGCYAFFIVMLLPTLYGPVLMEVYGNPDRGPIYAAYIGFALLGGTFVAIGIFMSSLTDNQIVAYILTLIVSLVLWILDWGSGFLGTKLSGVVSYVCLRSRFEEFPQGVVDTRNIIFFITAIAVFLFLATRSVESRRWR